jgi:hypothetical protein
VSINRFPPFTRVDFLAVSALLAALAYGVYAMASFWAKNSTNVEIAPFAIFTVASWAIFSWIAFYRPWTRRASQRLKYVAKHLGMDEAFPVAQMLRIGSILAGLMVPILMGAVIGGIVGAALHGMGLEDIWSYVPFTFGAVTGMILSFRVDDSGLAALSRAISRPTQMRNSMGEAGYQRHLRRLLD